MRLSTKSILRGTLAAGVASLALVAGLGTPASAIANGEPVPDGRYAFSVKLTMTGIPTADGGRRNSACSGVLIAPKWVLTAGHCFRDANGVRVERPVADETKAEIGRTDLTDTTRGHQTTIVAVRQSPTADVSLAELATPVEGIKPIRLGNTAPAVGDVVRVTGYGSLTGTNPTPATRLHTGKLKVASLSQSVVGVRGFWPAANTTPCPYDSGGPYFVEKKGKAYLVAVVSNGPTCPHEQIENGARTDNITAWIRGSVR